MCWLELGKPLSLLRLRYTERSSWLTASQVFIQTILTRWWLLINMSCHICQSIQERKKCWRLGRRSLTCNPMFIRPLRPLSVSHLGNARFDALVQTDAFHRLPYKGVSRHQDIRRKVRHWMVSWTSNCRSQWRPQIPQVRYKAVHGHVQRVVIAPWPRGQNSSGAFQQIVNAFKCFS